ncbi:MAG: hypothetical protein SFV32_06470 [Opitutaceae bacterium]|nr:hypothetical protein [Opitutaceae bacterium]
MRAFFFSRHLRERMLLVLFTAGVAAVVVTSATRKGIEFYRTDQRVNSELALQRAVLAQRPLIEARAQAAAERFDASRTFDSLRLASEVDAMTRSAGIQNFATADARTDSGQQFALHTLQLTIRNADYAALVRLYQEVMKHGPYIGIDQLTIAANTGNPGLLNANMQLSSVEIIRP